MKKIVCLYCCFAFGYFSSCSLVDVSPSKYNPYIDKFLQHGYKNTLPTSKKRNISHESNITKKTKQIEQDLKDNSVYDDELRQIMSFHSWLEKNNYQYPGLE